MITLVHLLEYHIIVGTDTGGKVYIFKYNSSNTAWNQHTILIPNDVVSADYFGYSLAMNENFAIIGSPADDDLGYSSGSVYIFRYEESNASFGHNLQN